MSTEHKPSKAREPLRIFGAGVRARLVADLIAWQFADSYYIEGYFDDRLVGKKSGPGGLPILGSFADGIRDMPRSNRRALVATGSRSCVDGCRVLTELRLQGVATANLVSPGAMISPSARLGENSVVFPGVFIGADVRIGDLFCAHGGAVVEHNAELGHNVVLGPGAILSGFVHVASHCFLGAGCTVHPQRKIGRGTLIGAGSVVVKDIPPHVVAFGTPISVTRPVRPGDDVPTPEAVAELSQIGFM